MVIKIFEWNDERLEYLRRLVENGASASEIASIFSEKHNTTISRNAIIGKCARSEIKLHRAPIKKQSSQSSKISAVKGPALSENQIKNLDRRHAAGKAKKKPMGRLLEKKKPIHIEVVIDHARLTIPNTAVDFLALENHHCRYPYGNEFPFMFCGDPTADLIGGKPYCETHHKICLYPPSKKIEEAA